LTEGDNWASAWVQLFYKIPIYCPCQHLHRTQNNFTPDDLSSFVTNCQQHPRLANYQSPITSTSQSPISTQSPSINTTITVTISTTHPSPFLLRSCVCAAQLQLRSRTRSLGSPSSSFALLRSQHFLFASSPYCRVRLLGEPLELFSFRTLPFGSDAALCTAYLGVGGKRTLGSEPGVR
jgi:hypothetical protein